MDKKPIKLTEQDLHFLVENAVRTYLVNEGIDEISWSGIKNMAGAGVDKLKQVGNTMGAAYYNGAANAQIQTQIATLQQKAQGRQDAATQNATNFNNRFKQWNTPNYQVTTNG